jgi:hypothetical protein
MGDVGDTAEQLISHCESACLLSEHDEQFRVITALGED